jgi:hypothetical protein
MVINRGERSRNIEKGTDQEVREIQKESERARKREE